MAIIYEETEGSANRKEVYASLIRIYGNPVDTAQSVIDLELSLIRYIDGVYDGSSPFITLTETAGDFAQREFTIGDKTLTGLEVIQVIKLFTADRYAEHVSYRGEENE